MVKTTINLDTQIYRELVKEALERYGTTKNLSRLINEKLAGMKKNSTGSDDIFKKTFGMWKIKETGAEYTRRIRAEGEKRMARWERG
jgi:hypothetical protein